MSKLNWKIESINISNVNKDCIIYNQPANGIQNK